DDANVAAAVAARDLKRRLRSTRVGVGRIWTPRRRAGRVAAPCREEDLARSACDGRGAQSDPEPGGRSKRLAPDRRSGPPEVPRNEAVSATHNPARATHPTAPRLWGSTKAPLPGRSRLQ